MLTKRFASYLQVLILVLVSTSVVAVSGGVFTSVGCNAAAGENGNDSTHTDEATEAAGQKLREEFEAAIHAAEQGDTEALANFCALAEKAAALTPSESAAFFGETQSIGEALRVREGTVASVLVSLSGIVAEARAYARTALGNPEYDPNRFDEFLNRVREAENAPATLADAADDLVESARESGDLLLEWRADLFARLQREMRRGKSDSTAMISWFMLRAVSGDPGVEVDPSSLQLDKNHAEQGFVLNGVQMLASMAADDFEKRITASVNGYNFSAGWTPLFRKPFAWMAKLAADMRKAGVSPERYPEWEIMEGAGGLIALTPPVADGTRSFFYAGALRKAEALPPPADAARMAENFRAAAKRLHDGVMADESISRQLRQALNPILMGTYLPVDPRDYFDAAFCRRVIEADYLDTFIKPMPEERRRELEVYRAALAKVEAGYDELSIDLGDGTRLVAVATPDIESGPDTDKDTGETLPRYTWRLEKADETIFFSPMPARSLYAFSLAEQYPGRHGTRPVGVPARTEVWHALRGRIASYAAGSDKAEGSESDWNAAIASDIGDRSGASMGPPGWGFSLHVLLRDDQGDPVLLATPNGVVKIPDFMNIADADKRRLAEDAWLDATARTLSSPGELGLIFHQFYRYCSDSPIPELPKLIGSHYGLADSHETVYESLERRWAGRLFGDCDDLAEFFQELTARQGKLSHVMQLPAHAACGYVERTEEGDYRFVVLQTGPVLQFTAGTLNEAVEMAYLAFDKEGGQTHFTAAAVPILLRFAGDQTRTPFVLSARIYEDRAYAESMIRVQSYWHRHVYSAGIREMEDMIGKGDRELGNLKELASLYERVGAYEKSASLRAEELSATGDDRQARLSTLLDIAQLRHQEKNRGKELDALAQMEETMREMVEREDAESFFRAMTFRSYWAMLLSRLGEPERAWKLLEYDVKATKRQAGRIPDAVLRTLVSMYEKMGTDAKRKDESSDVRNTIGKEIEEAFSRGFFRDDDAYNMIIGRYNLLGRYAVAKAGRADGLARLKQDGPYPEGPKDQTKRGRKITDEDWKWFRIAPTLYLSYGLEMTDKDEYPDLYDPQTAKEFLEDVERAVSKGTGLGSDIAGDDDMVKSGLALAFINRDLSAFVSIMPGIGERDVSSLYDDAALSFGLHCGLIPLDEFPAWIEAFRKYFPGRQHYFNVVYRAIDKENYDHALALAKATAAFFPDDRLMVEEAAFVGGIMPDLKSAKAKRDEAAEQEKREAENRRARDRQDSPAETQPPATDDSGIEAEGPAA